MGHSIQFNGEVYVNFRDVDLIAVVTLASAAVSQDLVATPAKAIVERWVSLLEGYTNGAIDLELEVLLESPGQQANLSQLWKTIADIVQQFGELIPAAFLNARNPAPGVTFSDFRTSLVDEALKKLSRLTETYRPGTGY